MSADGDLTWRKDWLSCLIYMRCCTLLVCRYSVAIMVDTEGSEVHTNELKEPIKAEVRAVIST